MWRIFHHLFDSMPSLPCDPAGQPESCILDAAWQQGTRILMLTQIRYLHSLPSSLKMNVFFPCMMNPEIQCALFFPLSLEHRNCLFATENGHSKQKRNYTLTWWDAVAEIRGESSTQAVPVCNGISSASQNKGFCSACLNVLVMPLLTSDTAQGFCSFWARTELFMQPSSPQALDRSEELSFWARVTIRVK